MSVSIMCYVLVAGKEEEEEEEEEEEKEEERRRSSSWKWRRLRAERENNFLPESL